MAIGLRWVMAGGARELTGRPPPARSADWQRPDQTRYVLDWNSGWWGADPTCLSGSPERVKSVAAWFGGGAVVGIVYGVA